MGAITAKGLKRVKKILLQMLKEDEVTVNLKKFVKLNKEEKKEIEKLYGIKFSTISSVRYKVNSIMLASTYYTELVADPVFT
jgi:hypothetical protein